MSLLDRASKFMQDYECGAYFKRLTNNPEPHSFRKPPVIYYHKIFSSSSPVVTIVTPAFEQEDNICKNISAIIKNCTMPFDWIFIDDGSTDETLKVVSCLLRECRSPHLCEAVVLSNSTPIFETACDNMGFYISRTEIIIEVQADIFIEEPMFAEMAISVSLSHLRPSAISGRCGHILGWVAPSLQLPDKYRNMVQGVGLIGEKIEDLQLVSAIKGKIFRCETVNRGPWILRRSDLESVGFLDERNYFLGNDDHDFHVRLYKKTGRLPVYLPMTINSPISIGSTRKKKEGINLEIFSLLKNTRKISGELISFMQNYEPFQFPEAISVSIS
ncbi:glycosyltransferase family 2 protein [Azospirillum oryzae]|uniref:glycosyltransferase family 2 protein n=1 Tax=Azospirillum oryzae TaxID=286727 RepID=UPI00142D56E2|nr:glycosyltransferase family 2 protein [Azospirillum oryzae]